MAARQPASATSARDFLPPERDLSSLRRAADRCEGCPLYADATQTVFGEGAADARLLVVGEQPGDEEDRQGRPFVGPAGRLLDGLLEEAEIDRGTVYVTNAVKHFNFTWRGKRRLHKKPRRLDVVACRPWLETEIAAVEPEVVLCLGATAAQSLLGSAFRITKQHGKVFQSDWCEQTLATYHPSAILRSPDRDAAAEKRAAVLEDLKLVRQLVHGR